MNENNKKFRLYSFLIILAVYLAAFFIGWVVVYLLKDLNLLLATFIADMAATIVVWIFGIIFKNASVYDPYWSVAPVFIASFWIIKLNAFYPAALLFLGAFLIWGTRLTVNWASRWKGLSHQDWRYGMIKDKNPKMWFLSNLFGINIIPTLFVFLGLTPVYYAFLIKTSFSVLSIFGFVVCIGAVFLQIFSDRQMDLFKISKNKEKPYIETGLWRYSRHPNYFGEVTFWWGIWIIGTGANTKAWITIIGPIAMTLLFFFISIPMMEKYVISSKPGYLEYKKKVSMLFIWFRKEN